MVLVKMVNNEAKVKAILAVSFFMISMLIVGMFALDYGKQIGYEEGYNQADQDWKDYLNEVWGPFVDAVYREGYVEGYGAGYLWGFVEGWNTYGGDEVFRYPDGGFVP